jgi:hypothetical protein
MFKKCFVLLLLYVSLLVGQRPSWIDNPQSKYPNRQFLTAVGAADTRKGAEQSAASNLSQIFESAIQSENTINERYKELFHGNSSTMEHESDISKNVTIRSNQTLYNVRYVESFTDADGRNYILAALDRAETGTIYRKKIGQNNDQVLFYMNNYVPANDAEKNYAYINAASVIAQVNDRMMKQLIIIDPAGDSVHLGYSYDNLLKQYVEAKKSVGFSIQIENDENKTLSATIEELLTSAGFSINASPCLRVSGELGFEDIDLQRSEKFIRWSYKLYIHDHKDNTVITLSDAGREGHITKGEAKARAVRTMKSRLNQKILRAVDKYFDGMVNK